MLWGLRQVEEMLERGSTTATNTTVAQEVEALRLRNQQLLEAMKEMLLMSPVQLFKEEAYVTICDFLILFCSQLSSSPHLSTLVYQPDRALQHMLNDFIQSYVFIDEEIGLLSKFIKKMLLDVKIVFQIPTSTPKLKNYTRGEISSPLSAN